MSQEVSREESRIVYKIPISDGSRPLWKQARTEMQCIVCTKKLIVYILFCYFGFHSKGCLSRTPLLILLDFHNQKTKAKLHKYISLNVRQTIDNKQCNEVEREKIKPRSIEQICIRGCFYTVSVVFQRFKQQYQVL